MSMKIKNLIAIAVGAIALLAIIAVIVLACYPVRPASMAGGWLEDASSVSVYFKGQKLAENGEGKLVGTSANVMQNGNYSATDLLDEMSFSLLSACVQFNYGFGLTNTTDEVNEDEIKDKLSEITSSTDTEGYSFTFSFAEAKTVTVSDEDGKSYDITYDSAFFTLTEDSEWAKTLTAYVYNTGIYNDIAEKPTKEKYYVLEFGAVTSKVNDILDDLFDKANYVEPEED